MINTLYLDPNRAEIIHYHSSLEDGLVECNDPLCVYGITKKEIE